LILGFNLAGAAKAILAGVVLITLGSIIAGIPDPLNPGAMARMMVLVVATSLALISMMFLLMVRVSDPLVPRAIFGVLNTVLYFSPAARFIRSRPFRVDESHHGGGPVHLRGAWVQAIDFEEHRPGWRSVHGPLTPAFSRCPPKPKRMAESSLSW
jgi:hypothetical protein